ncbi:MAG: class I SAM-dependent methyltransferase [Eubacteriales bacterium]|nr:class I SAM-dependent methyltransferase [Eubacteriales bacterium]
MTNDKKISKITGDKITASYRQSKSIYDDVLTQSRWWSRLYIRLFWGGVDDNVIAEKLLRLIPDDFAGKLLDVPVGTAVFTHRRYGQLRGAQITCLDYSPDMLEQARVRFAASGLSGIALVQGDVGKLPFGEASFDMVLSMNGFHAFPQKEEAYGEIRRVLRRGGRLLACFYVRGESRVTDALVGAVLARKGWFTPPFETVSSLRARLQADYEIEEFHVKGSMVWFGVVKK